jgi:hypothetical protein
MSPGTANNKRAAGRKDPLGGMGGSRHFLYILDGEGEFIICEEDVVP